MFLWGLLVRLLQNGLTEDEQNEHEDHPRLAIEERSACDAAPNQVRHKNQDRVAYNPWILRSSHPLQRRCKVALWVDQEVLHIVVDPAHAIGGHAGAPDQAVHEIWQQGGRMVDQLVDDVRVSCEELIGTVVVPVAISSDSQEVLNDCPRGLEATALDRPRQRRDTLSADLHCEHPCGTLPTRCTSNCLLHLLLVVSVDGFHHNGGTLQDGPHQTLGDEAQRPSESLNRNLILGNALCDFDAGRHEGPHELCGDGVADVAETQRRDVVHHLDRLTVEFHGHIHDFRSDQVQIGVGLLEVVLPCRCRHEEFGVDLLSHLEGLGLIQRTKELRQGCLPRRRITHGFVQKPFDILPQP
mmetsp:Transcript_21947/g.48527  ORF Transcript_21947/g.48527 Transcript_21947/m.48527 type:complete len:355 (-) Transcript_21947:1202-2266(-)